jgi:hypothetical protein
MGLTLPLNYPPSKVKFLPTPQLICLQLNLNIYNIQILSRVKIHSF